jgi:predicted Rossmann fold flavoprotein
VDCDIAVIGAGAAGLYAAICASGGGKRVVLLEKNKRPGLKILISGGGRCNLTTTKCGSDLEAQYGKRRGRWLRHALRAFPPSALIELIETLGVPLQEEDLDKIFPVSGRAGDVLDALIRRTESEAVEIVYEASMQGLTLGEGGFDLQLEGRSMQASRVILATGGLSYPKTGTTGDGYRVCAALGHSIVEPHPALAPLWIEEPWVRELAGVTLTDVILTLRAPDKRVLCVRQRPVLFTHKGLSGPGAMDLAGDIEQSEGPTTVELDFVPGLTREQIDQELLEAARSHGRRSVVNCLPRSIPERLRRHLVRVANAEVSVAELPKSKRRLLVESAKRSSVTVSRSLGFGHAEVTRGGVALDEVDARTMASKLVPNLFLCGEILDVDGPIGGFNFQAAFATGRLAGLAAAACLAD